MEKQFFKDQVCRILLGKLEDKGLIVLPPSKTGRTLLDGVFVVTLLQNDATSKTCIFLSKMILAANHPVASWDTNPPPHF